MTLTTEDSNSFFREMLEKTQDFDCTVQFLNDFLFQQAVEDNSKAVSRTYFLILNDKIVAFYTIAIDNVEIDVVNNKAIEYRLPVLKVIALAVDKKVQNMRMGSMIIKQIYKKVMNLHKEVAITGVYLIAYRSAVDFYRKMGFHLIGPEYLLNLPTMNEFKMVISREEINNLISEMD